MGKIEKKNIRLNIKMLFAIIFKVFKSKIEKQQQQKKISNRYNKTVQNQ
jgi:hypothetical protein